MSESNQTTNSHKTQVLKFSFLQYFPTNQTKHVIRIITSKILEKSQMSQPIRQHLANPINIQDCFLWPFLNSLQFLFIFQRPHSPIAWYNPNYDSQIVPQLINRHRFSISYMKPWRASAWGWVTDKWQSSETICLWKEIKGEKKMAILCSFVVAA